jgi:hypothetical protein
MSAPDKVKEAFCEWVGAWFKTISPDTRPLQEYVARDLQNAVVLAPGRMIDQVEEMLSKYRVNDNGPGPSTNSQLPVIILALAKDVTPSGGEYGRSIGEDVDISIPGDPHQRVFKLRQLAVDQRAQVVFVAADEPTAKSMAMQFLLYVSTIGNRRFNAMYNFAGFTHAWPVTLESSDVLAINMQNDQKNLTTLAMDLQLRTMIPYFRAPSADDADSFGGFKVVEAVISQEYDIGLWPTA